MNITVNQADYDSDGDGIPNATDPEPNTPATKSTKTVKTPIKTPVKTVVKPSVTPVETAATAAGHHRRT